MADKIRAPFSNSDERQLLPNNKPKIEDSCIPELSVPSEFKANKNNLSHVTLKQIKNHH
jgi:hypothetical protein